MRAAEMHASRTAVTHSRAAPTLLAEGYSPTMGPPVAVVQLSGEGKFAFVEFRDELIAVTALQVHVPDPMAAAPLRLFGWLIHETRAGCWPIAGGIAPPHPSMCTAPPLSVLPFMLPQLDKVFLVEGAALGRDLA